MSFFSTDALNPGVRKREVFGWAMFDFANSSYTTVVISVVCRLQFRRRRAFSTPLACRGF